MTKTKDPIELAARAICRHEGLQEDATFYGRPMWENFIPKAEAVLAALNEAGLLKSAE